MSWLNFWELSSDSIVTKWDFWAFLLLQINEILVGCPLIAVQGHHDQLANANDLREFITVITCTMSLMSKCYHVVLAHFSGSISHCYSYSAENSHYNVVKGCLSSTSNIFLEAFFKGILFNFLLDVIRERVNSSDIINPFQLWVSVYLCVSSSVRYQEFLAWEQNLTWATSYFGLSL